MASPAVTRMELNKYRSNCRVSLSSGIICVLPAGQLDVELDLLTNRLKSAEGYLEMQNMSVVICLCEEDLLGKMKPKLYSYTERRRKTGMQTSSHFGALFFEEGNKGKDT